MYTYKHQGENKMNGMRKQKERRVAGRNRTVRLYETQEVDVAILEKHGFSFQKLAREAIDLVIAQKIKLIELEASTK